MLPSSPRTNTERQPSKRLQLAALGRVTLGRVLLAIPGALRAVAAGILQSTQKGNHVPAVGFGEGSEGRHAGFGIAVGNFPEQGAIALRLDFRGAQVGGAGVFAAAIFLMAADAGAHVKLAADGLSIRVLGLRVGLGGGVGGRFPFFSRRIVGLRNSQADQAGKGKRGDDQWFWSHSQWLRNSLRSLLRKPRIS